MTESRKNTFADFMESARQAAMHDAAEELMERLRRRGVTDENWNGGDVVEVVDTWLQEKGVDTSQPDPYGAEDEEEEEEPLSRWDERVIEAEAEDRLHSKPHDH